MAPPQDTPPAAVTAPAAVTVPATVPGPRSDEDAAAVRLAADTFIGGALDDAKRAVDRADHAIREGDIIDAAMCLAVARSAREDAHRAARVIGRHPR